MKPNKNQIYLQLLISSRFKRNLPEGNTLVKKLRLVFSINTNIKLRIHIVRSPMIQL